jgi:Uncharacterized conserved protein
MWTIFVSAFAALSLAHTPACAHSSAAPSWRIQGDLSESCSCAVPCSCNFGQSPSPHSFCYALFSLDIKDGKYGDTDLTGLHLAGANGAKGLVWYIDDRANKDQAAALKSIGRTIMVSAWKANGIKDPQKAPPEFRLRGYKTAKIEQSVGDKKSTLKIGKSGYFTCDYIMGMDGKTPVKVENNWSWNITDGTKGKSKVLQYKDEFGNSYSYKGVNANVGKFDWSDSTPIYFR